MKDDDIISPVMGDGKFASWLPFFAGMTIWEASKPICSKLEEAGALQDISHMPARVKCAVLGWHTMEKLLDHKDEQ